MLKTAILTKDMKPGVYVLTKKVAAWKGFRRNGKPYITTIELPRGAIVVVPLHREGEKVRTDRFFLPGKGALESPIQNYDYERGRHYTSRLDKRLSESCGRGLNFSLTRAGAQYWAGYY